MSVPILSRWAVAIEVEVLAKDLDPEGRVKAATLEEWFALARAAYFERCPTVTSNVVVPAATEVRVSPGEATGEGAEALVAVSATELRPRSFDMRCRVRNLSSGGGILGTGWSSIAVTDPRTGEEVELPDVLRDTLLSLEAGAGHYA